MKFLFVIRRIFLLLVGLSILGIFYFLQFRPHNLLARDVQGEESESSDYRSILFDEIKERSGMVYEPYDRKLRGFLTTYEPESWPNLTAAESYPSLIPEGLRITHPTPKYLPGTNISLPLLIVHPYGRFGNIMGKYATAFAIGKLYNVPIAMTTDMMVLLNETFPHLSTKLTFTGIFARSNCTSLIEDKYTVYPGLQVAASGYFGRKCFSVLSYPFEMRLFNFYREKVMKEFTFSDDIQREVLDFFSTIRRNLSQQDAFRDSVDPVFIGIHARRTDYSWHIKQLGGKLPGENFYKRAIQYYRQKFPTPIFVASSDSMNFIKKTLKGEPGVFFTPGESASVDMATLSSCNHSIFSLGSFGFWSSYLAGGEVVYANLNTSIPYKFSAPFYEDARISNFTPLNCDSD